MVCMIGRLLKYQQLGDEVISLKKGMFLERSGKLYVLRCML